MELKHLRTFSTVAELGSVSKAALQLRVAQPALSRQIIDLEKELGLKLFDRIGRRLLLTREGEQLVENCRRVLGQVVGIAEQARIFHGGQAGSLKIGASPLIMESVLPTFLSRYAKTFPRVEVKLVEVVGRDQLIMLQRGEIDIGIGLLGAAQVDQRFANHQLATVEILAACHPLLELARKTTVEIATLGRYPLLLPDSSYAFRKLFDAACRLAEIEPTVFVESRAPHALIALAEAGHGVAIIQTIVPTSRYKVRIVRVTQDRKPMRLPMAAIWDRRRPLPHYAEEFCKLLSEQMRRIIAQSK
jgi:DNA-binding transcriptional LysR family regulator